MLGRFLVVSKESIIITPQGGLGGIRAGEAAPAIRRGSAGKSRRRCRGRHPAAAIRETLSPHSSPGLRSLNLSANRTRAGQLSRATTAAAGGIRRRQPPPRAMKFSANRTRAGPRSVKLSAETAPGRGLDSSRGLRSLGGIRGRQPPTRSLKLSANRTRAGLRSVQLSAETAPEGYDPCNSPPPGRGPGYDP